MDMLTLVKKVPVFAEEKEVFVPRRWKRPFSWEHKAQVLLTADRGVSQSGWAKKTLQLPFTKLWHQHQPRGKKEEQKRMRHETRAESYLHPWGSSWSHSHENTSQQLWPRLWCAESLMQHSRADCPAGILQASGTSTLRKHLLAPNCS